MEKREYTLLKIQICNMNKKYVWITKIKSALFSKREFYRYTFLEKASDENEIFQIKKCD